MASVYAFVQHFHAMHSELVPSEPENNAWLSLLAVEKQFDSADPRDAEDIRNLTKGQRPTHYLLEYRSLRRIRQRYNYLE